ncbi:MAG: sulfatase-like hydrolase/transferase, partial [Planctomycetaceae bacterium]|nr:sulfatase-like hydrolase/transferase [Planctomycetaceae bacterium]
VAHGSIRMEPVFMALSQSAAIAAGMAIDKDVNAQEVPYPELLKKLEAAKQIVRPDTWKRTPAQKKSPPKPAPKKKAPEKNAVARSVDAASKPNIVLILADDLGIECLSAYGGKSHKTPHLDQLAKEGMRFTQCFSNPFCSPSRGQLLTGRYPFQNGLKVVLHSRSQENIYLRPSQPSFARQLKQYGYSTQIVGKWHVALEHKHDTTREFGFDHSQTWQIFDENGDKTTRYWTPYLKRDGTVIAEKITDRYGPDVDLEVYLDFIESRAKAKTPFLAFYSTCLPHYPWEPTPDSSDRTYRASGAGHKGDPKYFPEMVAYLDKQIGVMLQKLDNLGIADNTIVIFLADNGTDRDIVNTWGEGQQISGGKGTMTDRGTHVPLIVRWPGNIEAGSTCDDLVDLSDIFPTICDLTGSPMPEQTLHGRAFASQLRGDADKPGQQNQPRDWIHIQNADDRQVRNRDYMLNNKGQLRRVVPLSEAPSESPSKDDAAKEAAARLALQAAFETLGP